MKKLLIISGVALLVIIGIVYIALGRQGTSYTAVANNYMDYLHRGDSESSYSMLSSDQKTKINKPDWDKYVKEASDKFPSSCQTTVQLPINNPEKTYPEKSNATRYACDFMLNGGDYRIIFVFVTEESEIMINEMQGYALL